MSKMDGEGVDLSSLSGPPLYRQPSDSTARTFYLGDEAFLLPDTPKIDSPEIIDDYPTSPRAFATKSYQRMDSDGLLVRNTFSRSVLLAPPATAHSYQGSGPTPPWQTRLQLRRCQPQWHSSYNMYICFLFGFLCAAGHHIFYASLNGRLAESQTEMLRYGTFLAYAAKSGFSAAVVIALKQRTWLTVRRKFTSIRALDSMFAAAEDIVAMFSYDFLRDAKGAYALALFAWTTPLVVILTANTLLVQPTTMKYNGQCPNVRSLNFTFEETYDWRDPVTIDGLFETPVSIWNTTKQEDESLSDPGWFDYYTGPHPVFQATATLAAYLKEVVPRKDSSIDTCGSGWNCTFSIEFTGPGYNCTEVASGADSTPRNLVQSSGEISAPFTTDLLLPRGNYSYYAYTSGGEYSSTQLKNVGVGGIPNMKPPLPSHFGALRTEPIIWIGYVVAIHQNESQPARNESGWKDALSPRILACEHRETSYIADFTYTGEVQTAKISSRTYGSPIIDTTFVPNTMAMDATDDNTTAIPESNYVYPNDTRNYRRVAAYHSLGEMLRTFINGTVEISDTLIQPIENTQAIQTKLLDGKNNYMPHSDLQSQLMTLYDDIILSMFSNPQFAGVVWAAKPDEQSGMLSTDAMGAKKPGYMYPCQRFRTANTYSYRTRDLWIVYTIAATITLACIAAGALAIRENGGVTRNTRFSSIVAATRGPALEKIAWMGPLQDRGDVPAEVKKLRLGYGVMTTDVNRKLAAMGVGLDPNLMTSDEDERTAEIGSSTGYNSGFIGEIRCGFGLKHDVDQRHREGSLFHR